MSARRSRGGGLAQRLMANCWVTELGLPIHVQGSTAETWKRCQCGAKEADLVDGKIVVRDVLN